MLCEQLLSGADAAEELGKDYPHRPEQITLKCLMAKLKAVRQNTGKLSIRAEEAAMAGVIMCYFDLCNQIWGGSPATDQLQSGVESTDMAMASTGGEPSGVMPDASGIEPGEAVEDSMQHPQGSNDGDREEGDAETSTGEQSDAMQMPSSARLDQDSSSQRRSLLNQQLATYRHQKLKRKLPVDSQLLECAWEDLKVKRTMVEEMNKMDKMLMDNMAQLSQNMSQMSSTVANAFATIRSMLLPNAQGPSPYCPSRIPFSPGPPPCHPHQPVHPNQMVSLYQTPQSNTTPPIHRSPDSDNQPWPGADFEDTN